MSAGQPRYVVPLIVDTRFLRPLSKAMYDSPCHRCDRRQSRWEMGPPFGGEVYTVCSLCFLYESKWGEKRVDQIHVLVDEIEREVGEKFLRGADGRTLLSCKDADRVLAAIAMTSRMFQLQDGMKEKAGEPSGGEESHGDPIEKP